MNKTRALISLYRSTHRKKKVIRIESDFNQELIQHFKAYTDCFWSQSTKTWYIPEDKFDLESFLKAFQKHVDINYQKIRSIPKSSLPEKQKLNTNQREEFIITITTLGYLEIKLPYPFQIEWVEFLKKIPGRWYDADSKVWSFPHREDKLLLLQNYFTELGFRVTQKMEPGNKRKTDTIQKQINEIRQRTLRPEVHQELTRYEQYLESKRYSPHTRSTYLSYLNTFLKFHHDKTLTEITQDEFDEFINGFIIRFNYSISSQNQAINAVKLFFRRFYNSNFESAKIERPRRSKRLPVVLSKEEVEMIFRRLKNLKHRMALFLIYACGLRRSELINLRLKDIDSKRRIMHIKNAKGAKDRIVPLSEKILIQIKEYYLVYRPQEYLIENPRRGQYSPHSLYKIFKRAMNEAGILKNVGLHSLRHSYATHLHESGTDIRFIQELLGHKSSKTTEIYTHVSSKSLQNIKSPFDDLELS